MRCYILDFFIVPSLPLSITTVDLTSSSITIKWALPPSNVTEGKLALNYTVCVRESDTIVNSSLFSCSKVNDGLDTVNGSLAVVNGTLGIASGSLAMVNGSLVIANGSLAMVNRTLVTVNGSLAMVNGSLVIANGSLAMVNRTLVTVNGSLAMVNGSLVMVNGSLAMANGTLVMVSRSLAMMNGTFVMTNGSLDTVNGTLAIVNSNLGMVKSSLSNGSVTNRNICKINAGHNCTSVGDATLYTMSELTPRTEYVVTVIQQSYHGFGPESVAHITTLQNG